MEINTPKKIIVIGAGPAGLTAAFKLAQGGAQVTIFEASDHVGGLARSFELWGQIVDCGPHRFFSNDNIVNDFFKEIAGNNYVTIIRMTRIYYKQKFFHYPLKISNVLHNLSPIEVGTILWSYFLQQVAPIKNPKTFEDWVVNKFGRKLFTIFFKNYSEKLWGIPSKEIDAEWAAQRIKNFSLYEAVKAAVFGNSSKKHKTLIDEFAYPTYGTGMLYKKMAAGIEAMDGKIFFNAPIEKVLLNDSKASGVKLRSGETYFADHIISTMPLTLMVRGLDNVPVNVKTACDKLFYRNTILVYLEIDSLNLFPDNWIYVHSPEVKHGRITNFRNWSPQLYGDKNTTILCLEYWCFDKDDIWKADNDYMTLLAENELKSTGLIQKNNKVLNSFIVHLPKCYPVYETGYHEHITIIKDYVDTISNLRVIGRYGAFKYNNQDHSILMGLLAAKEILTGSNENLWAINTDSEYHEKGEAIDAAEVEKE
jgi:protoporphyrinogen oxidase